MAEKFSSVLAEEMLMALDDAISEAEEIEFSDAVAEYGEWSPHSGEVLCHRLKSESERRANAVARHIAKRNVEDATDRHTLAMLLARYDQVEARLSNDIELFEGDACCADKARSVTGFLVDELLAGKVASHETRLSWEAPLPDTVDAWVAYARTLTRFIGGWSSIRELADAFESVRQCYLAPFDK